MRLAGRRGSGPRYGNDGANTVNKTRLLFACISMLSVVLAALLFVFVRRANANRIAAEETHPLAATHCGALSFQLHLAERNVRESLPILQSPNATPETRDQAMRHTATSTFGQYVFSDEARGLLSLYVLTEGYFCIRASGLSEHERSSLNDELGIVSQRFAEVRDPVVVADALARLSAIVGVGEGDRQ